VTTESVGVSSPTDSVHPMTRATPRPNLRERFDVLASSGFRCDYCGASGKSDNVRLQVDHVVSRAQGGTHERTNLVTACGPCNLGKSDRPVPYPRWVAETRWDRCLCPEPSGLSASQSGPVLVCADCRLVRYRRVFGVAGGAAG
jgi:hypothetical protein